METETNGADRLTNWSVSPDGARVELRFDNGDGHACAITLPVEALSGLLMTIPRMLGRALVTRFADPSLRVVHPLGNWRVQRATGTDASLLSLATADGFEVTFAVPTPQADRLAASLWDSAEQGVTKPALN